MSSQLPWMKFYPSDWRSDPCLRMCSLAARGLWMEILGLMHEAEPYGHLLVRGSPPTDAQLAMLAGAAPDQIPELLGELESAGVFSRTRQGVIYSRRMTKDEKKRRVARKNGQNGGNPTLRNKKGNSASDNPPDKDGVKLKRPEARDQSPENTPLNPPKGETNGHRQDSLFPKEKAKGSRLPRDWALPREWGEWAVSQGLTREQVRFEADGFKDYWIGVPGQKGVKSDWYATWRNRIRSFMQRNNISPRSAETDAERRARLRERIGIA